MENFIVSARKYRPATFDMVVGQDSITSTLKNAIRNQQLAQAFLFCGPRGVGKTTCARILAKTINCFHPVNQTEPCNECESCVSFNQSNSFNIHELDAASNNSVDDIRNLVEQVRIPPQVGKYKIYIIDEVHMLSANAFNAFLKTLEEPPPYAKFILATTEKHKIIPTILSRCQIFDFKRITVKDISDYLLYVAKNEGISTSEEALHMIAQKADGALRDALSFFDQLVSFSGKELSYETVIEHLNILDHTYYFKILDQILNRDTAATLLTINEIIERGFEGQHFIIGLGEHFRNLLVAKDPSTISLLEVSPAVQSRYLQQSTSCSSEFLLKALEIQNQCDLNYKMANNKRLLIELALLQICTISSAASNKVEKKKSLIEPGPASTENIEKAPSQAGDYSPATSEPVKHKPPENKVAVQSEKRPSSVKIPSEMRTISIRPENHKEKADNGNGKTEMDPDKFDNQDFDQEKFMKVWNYFKESIARQHPSFYNTLKLHEPLLKENFRIELPVDNKVLETTVQEHKMEMLDFLRNELQNYKISLDTIILEKGESTLPYTADEKYQSMVEKNPNLKILKDKLDLEVEY